MTAAWAQQPTTMEAATAATAAATDIVAARPAVVARRDIRDRATWLVEATWLVLLVAVPAAFDPAGALAFEPLKTSLLRAGAAIAAAAWLLRRTSRCSDGVAMGSQPVVRAGLALIALAGVSTLLSVEPWLSFFGSFDRGMGWLSLAAGGVALVCIADVFADPQRRERLITALVLSALLPCGYLLLQRIGRDPVVWTGLGTPGSSLASPTFLGGYLVLIAPFALYRAIKCARSASLAYAFWLATLLIVCASTVLTTIRAPILGLCVGLALFAARTGDGWRVRIVATGGALIVVLALAATAGGASALERFLTIASAGDSSVERLTVWREAPGLPLTDLPRFALGFGPETQAGVLEHAEATVRLTQNQQWDRAHNVLLDTYLTQGVLGVLALAFLIGTVVWSAWRAGRTQALLSAAILGALVGHLVEVSFAFESVTSSMVFWLICGLAASLTPCPRVARRAGPRWPIWVGVAAAGLLVPLLVTPAVADWMYGQARRASVLNGALLEDTAAAWAPWVEELPRAAALDWQRVGNAPARVEADLLIAASRAPTEPFPQLRLLRWYLLRHDLASAETACQRALLSGPFRSAVWDACADVSLARDAPDQAAVQRARAEELRHPF